MGYLLSLQPTFTQGLVIGQLSILVLLALVLKYLFFVSDPSTSHHLPTTTATIPRSAQDVPHEHSTESTRWLNVVLREIMETYRAALRDNHVGPEGDESTRAKVEKQLNSMRPEGFVDPILVHSVNLGTSAPHLSNARINSSQMSRRESGEVEFDMIYTDTASISFSTSVLFNYPFPYFARLPVSLTLSLSVFSSKIILTPPRATFPVPSLTVSLAPSFTLDFHISSLLGSRAKLADVPKLHDMIESQIKKTLASHGTWTIPLPGVACPHPGSNVHCDSNGIDVTLIGKKVGRPPDLAALRT